MNNSSLTVASPLQRSFPDRFPELAVPRSPRKFSLQSGKLPISYPSPQERPEAIASDPPPPPLPPLPLTNEQLNSYSVDEAHRQPSLKIVESFKSRFIRAEREPHSPIDEDLSKPVMKLGRRTFKFKPRGDSVPCSIPHTTLDFSLRKSRLSAHDTRSNPNLKCKSQSPTSTLFSIPQSPSTAEVRRRAVSVNDSPKERAKAKFFQNPPSEYINDSEEDLPFRPPAFKYRKSSIAGKAAPLGKTKELTPLRSVRSYTMGAGCPRGRFTSLGGDDLNASPNSLELPPRQLFQRSASIPHVKWTTRGDTLCPQKSTSELQAMFVPKPPPSLSVKGRIERCRAHSLGQSPSLKGRSSPTIDPLSSETCSQSRDSAHSKKADNKAQVDIVIQDANDQRIIPAVLDLESQDAINVSFTTPNISANEADITWTTKRSWDPTTGNWNTTWEVRLVRSGGSREFSLGDSLRDYTFGTIRANDYLDNRGHEEFDPESAANSSRPSIATLRRDSSDPSSRKHSIVSTSTMLGGLGYRRPSAFLDPENGRSRSFSRPLVQIDALTEEEEINQSGAQSETSSKFTESPKGINWRDSFEDTKSAGSRQSIRSKSALSIEAVPFNAQQNLPPSPISPLDSGFRLSGYSTDSVSLSSSSKISSTRSSDKHQSPLLQSPHDPHWAIRVIRCGTLTGNEWSGDVMEHLHSVETKDTSSKGHLETNERGASRWSDTDNETDDDHGKTSWDKEPSVMDSSSEVEA